MNIKFFNNTSYLISPQYYPCLISPQYYQKSYVHLILCKSHSIILPIFEKVIAHAKAIPTFFFFFFCYSFKSVSLLHLGNISTGVFFYILSSIVYNIGVDVHLAICRCWWQNILIKYKPTSRLDVLFQKLHQKA